MNFLNWFVNIRIFKDSLTNSKILRIPAGVLNTMVFILKPQQVKPQQLQQPMFPEDLVDVCILKRNQKKTFKFISYYYFFNKKEHDFTLSFGQLLLIYWTEMQEATPTFA